MTMKFSFDPTRADLVRAAYVGLQTRPVVFAICVAIVIALPGIVALFTISAIIQGTPIPAPPFLKVMLLPPIVFGALGGLIHLQVGGAVSLTGRHTYEFSETGIRLTGPGFDSHLEWKLVTRCQGSKHGLLFFSGNAAYIFIPGRVLSNSSRSELRALVAAKGIKRTGHWGSEA